MSLRTLYFEKIIPGGLHNDEVSDILQFTTDTEAQGAEK